MEIIFYYCKITESNRHFHRYIKEIITKKTSIFGRFRVSQTSIENKKRKDREMKSKRQEKIRELIEMFHIETQDELAEKLQEEGFPTTQATISRDIREMKLTKISDDSGRQKYIVMQPRDTDTNGKYKRVLADGILSLDVAQNMIVIKTVVGMAMAVAAAIDNLNIQGIMGCIAGDDTIFCVSRDEMTARNVIKNMRNVGVYQED